MKSILIGSLVVLGLLALDRLLLRMEERGWIYYRRRKASPGAAGRAFLEIQKFLDPSTRHVLEMKEEKREHEDDGSTAGGGRPPQDDG